MPQTTMARETEVEGFTVDAPESWDDDSVQEEEAEPVPDAFEQSETEGESSTEGTAVEQSEKTPAPRTQRRMEKLVDKLKGRTDEAAHLREELERLKGGNIDPYARPNVGSQIFQTEGEITPEQYQADVAATADALVQARLRQYDSANQRIGVFERDLAEVEAAYDFLNPESESYQPKRAETIAQLYDKASSTDPKLRLKDFVDSIMSFREEGLQTGQKTAHEQFAKAAAQQAVSPTPSSQDTAPSDRSWDNMTWDEKESWMKEQGYWD